MSDAEFLHLSIGQFLRRVAAQAPERTALICADSGRHWRYRELLAASERAAHALLRHFRPGDPVATWGQGSADLLQLHLGAALAGIVLVTLNPACRGAEVEEMLRRSRARGLFLDREFRGQQREGELTAIRERLPALENIFFSDEWPDFVDGAVAQPLPEVDAGDPALILFTSGTTGRPKAALLRHDGVLNNARLTAQCLALPAGSVWLNLLPLFHIGGSATITLGCFANAGTQVLLPQFDADRMLAAIERHRVNTTMAVPTMLVGMLESERFASTDISSLRLIVTGGAVVSPELVRRVMQSTGAEVMTLFGQTEASGTMCVTRRGDGVDTVTGTVGAPLPLCRARIVSAGGEELPAGEVGEICIHTPCAMDGYLDMPEQTAATLDAEGWLQTGDMGYLRADGYVQITGRLKEMIIRGGENIYPREIEDRLAEHPAVAQSAVFGVEDPTWGEQVAAAVILRAGHAADEDELAGFLRSRIAAHKVPRRWLFTAQLPVNASGKVQKFRLQEQLAEAGQ